MHCHSSSIPTRKSLLNIVSFLALFALIIGAVYITPVYAAGVIVVNTAADNTANDGRCTLREAITAAITNTRSGSSAGECAAGGSGLDSISFSGDYTITVSSQLPVITRALKITGRGAANTTIEADGDPNVRLFQVASGGNLTLDLLTVRNGRCRDSCTVSPAAGGAIYNEGTLTILNSNLTDNSALVTGGAIHNTGTVTLTDTILSGNSAPAHDVGGGTIYNAGTLTMTDSSILESGSYFGGGVYNYGTMSVTHGTFSGNDGRAGGAIYNRGDLTITDSDFLENSAATIGGGAILSDGSLSITDTSFVGNSVFSGYGGALRAVGTTTILRVRFSDNSYAGIANGGNMTITDSLIADSTNGGGIRNTGGLSVIASTFVGNWGGWEEAGALYNLDAGSVNVTNSTITGNSGSYAGGISNAGYGTVTVSSSTIAGNSAAGDFGGGISNDDAATTILKNTIVANNGTANCYGTISNGGHNLDSGTSCGWNSAFGSLSSTDPMLGGLNDNGGPTDTMALLAGSPAIDAGNDINCPAFDQRGVPRGHYDCDMGAYEYDGAPPRVSGVSRNDGSPTKAGTVHFTVRFTESVTGVDTSDFALTVNGVTGASITGVSGSAAEYMVTVSTGAGDGTIRLDVIDNDSILDPASNPLGGTGPGNGNFNSGEEYSILKSVATPGVPVLMSPATGTVISTLQPVFDWQDSIPGAQHYHLQIATDRAFSAVIFEEKNIAASTHTPGWPVLLPGKLYYWHVRAFSQVGESSAWSAHWTVRTPLPVPLLVSPAQGSVLTVDRPAFAWNLVDGATQYNLQVSAVGNFSKLLLNTTVTTTGYTLTRDLPQDKTLYWRVRAKSPVVTGLWSVMWPFKSGNPPSVPVLVSPASNALVKDYTPFLNWNNSKLPAGTTFKHYEIQVDDNKDFSSLVIGATTTAGDLSDSDFTPLSDLASNTKYYLRLRAVNTVNGQDHISGWSAYRSFRTVLLSPTGLAVLPNTGKPLRPIFDWDDAIGPEKITGYTIQLSLFADFRTLLVNSTVPSSSYTSTKDLPLDTTLYWRLRVNGANGPSAWTTVQFVVPE